MRGVLVLPAVALIVFFVARMVAPIGAEAAVNRVFNVAAFAVAAAGCFVAARAFTRGDYLRVAWQLQAVASVLLAVSSVLRDLEPAATMLLARAPLVFMANTAAVLSAVIFARAHRIAGLELPWSRPARLAFIAGVAALAMLAAGPSVAVLVPRARAADLVAWMQIFSAVGDLLFLVLVAPIFMTAVALRGGLLTWPWALLTASTVTWLLYDAQDSIVYLYPRFESLDRTIVTVPLRVLACALLLAAALTQRRVTTGAVDRSGA
jgi:hypothetical protein